MCYNIFINNFKIMPNNMEKNREAKNDIKLNVPVAFKIVESKADGEKGVIEAYVSIFGNIDLVGDVIERGAFAESLAHKLPKGVWAHNWDEPIAKTLEAREDEKGLFIRGQFIDGVQRADEAYKLIKGGVIDEFSIGFRVLDDEWREDGVRVIKKARLYEWSPVLVGANPDTELVNIKSAEQKCEECDNVEKNKPDEKPDEENQEEKPEENDEKMVNKVAIITDKGLVRVSFTQKGVETVEEFKMSDSFINYKKEQKNARNTKVDNNAEAGDNARKILRIREVVEKNLKATKFLLKIVK